MEELTQKQLEANRENAKLGGVKTDKGKEISKMNAMKHGLLSSQVLIKDEDVNELSLIENNLKNQLCPVNQIEALLVDRIIAGFWRLKRGLKIETSLMSLQSYDNSIEISFYGENSKETKKIADMINNDLLDRLLRYENNIERGIFKALHELQRLQAIRRGEQVLAPLAVEIGVRDAD